MYSFKAEPTARGVMTADPVCVGPATSIRELAQLFEHHEISGTPVVDQSGVLVGIVSKTDLIRRCSEGTAELPPAYLFEVLSEQGAAEDTADVIPEPLVCVEDFMTEGPATVPPDLPIAEIARRMSDSQIHRVIVVDEDGFPVGIVTSLDLLRHWASWRAGAPHLDQEHPRPLQIARDSETRPSKGAHHGQDKHEHHSDQPAPAT